MSLMNDAELGGGEELFDAESGIQKMKVAMLDFYGDQTAQEQLFQKYKEDQNLKTIQKQISAAKAAGESTKALEEALAQRRSELQNEYASECQALNEELYDRLTLSEKHLFHKKSAKRAKEQAADIKQVRELERVKLKLGGATEEELRKFDEETVKMKSDLELEALEERAAASKAEADAKAAAFEKEQADKQGKYDQKGIMGKGLSKVADNSKEARQEKQSKLDEIAKAALDAAKEAEEAYDEALNDPNADPAKLEELEKKKNEALLNAMEKGNEAAANKMKDAVKDALSGKYKELVGEVESNLMNYKAIVDSRLQGSDKTYEKLSNKISTSLSTSPLVKTSAALENMREAVEQGIVYNLEQRAFLATVADKIAHTFDAFDSNLMRLIRLQQADTTAARLGMEASLTKFFNNMFNDSSYLNDLYDTVSKAIFDANSQLDKNAATEFEYIVQKWMGSLVSVGISEETVSTISEGLNYLATGDVTSLSSNETMQTLMAMSASRAGLEYSEILLNGLDAGTTNKLLASMVDYLREIAEKSENQVVKSAYSNVLGISVSDMKAISNLSAGDISNISARTMTYSDMMNEVNMQLETATSRMSMPEILGNVYENVLYGVAEDMTTNVVTYSMQKMLDFLDETKTDIYIPFINAMGFGLDLNATVGNLMQMGLGIGQGMSLAGNILSGLVSGPASDLSSWGGTEFNKRGGGLILGATGQLGATSGGGSFVGNQSSEDMKNSSMQSATDDAEDTKEITNKNTQSEKTFDDFYTATIGESASEFIKVREVILPQVFEESGKYLRVSDARMNFDNGNLMVRDNKLHDMTLIRLRAIEEAIKSQTAELGMVKLHPSTRIKLDENEYKSFTNAINSAGINLSENERTALVALLLDTVGKGADGTLGGLLKRLTSGLSKPVPVSVDTTTSGALPIKNAEGQKLDVRNLVW